MEIDKNKECELEIQKFSELIDTHYDALNQEAIWLFLATLGCLSIENNELIQSVAYLIAFFLFAYRVYSKTKNKRPFDFIYKDIKLYIEKNLEPSDTRKARLHDLDTEKKKFSFFQMVKRNFIFIVCYIFLVASYYFG